MTKEEALSTLMKMRAWRAWGKEQKEGERPEMPEQKEVDEALNVCIELLQKSFLPSNLDEVAQRGAYEYCVEHNIGELCGAEVYDAFEQGIKVGAEWMAGQDITVTGDTDDDYVRILKDIEEAICKIASDSTVSVQVRK